MVKNVASCESDEGLQRALFQAALSYENIDAHASLLPDKEQQLIALTEELKSLALTPFRVSVHDYVLTLLSPALLSFICLSSHFLLFFVTNIYRKY